MPFEADAARRHRTPKRRHRATNRAACDAGLRQRGSLAVRFAEEAVAARRAAPRTTRGGQPRHSALATLAAPALRAVLRPGLRQAGGLTGPILRLLGPDPAVPDHATPGRRAATPGVPRPRSGGGPLHPLVDGAGLRPGGAGERPVEKHGARTRRARRDRARARTSAPGGSGPSRRPRARPATVPASGPCSTSPRGRRRRSPATAPATGRTRATPSPNATPRRRRSPPRRDAAPGAAAGAEPARRDRRPRPIAGHGRAGRQKASGYDRRASAKSAVSRYERVVGDALRSRTDRRRAAGVAVAVRAPNRLPEPGRPESVRVA